MTQPLAMVWLDRVDDNLDLIACCYRVAIRLKRYMQNETAETFVTIETIAHDLGVHIRTVRRGIRALIGAGHLEKADVSTPKGGTRPGFRGLVSNGQICPPPTTPNKEGTTQEKREQEMNSREHPIGPQPSLLQLQKPDRPAKPVERQAEWWPEDRPVIPMETRDDFDRFRIGMGKVSSSRDYLRYVWERWTPDQLRSAYRKCLDSSRPESKWLWVFNDAIKDHAAEAAAPKPAAYYTLDEQRAKWPTAEPEVVEVDDGFAAMVAEHGVKKAIDMVARARVKEGAMEDPELRRQKAKVQALRDAGDVAGAEFWAAMYRGEEVGGSRGGSAYE